MPIPPPCRLLKDTLFNGLVETEESKRRTKAWRDGKCVSCIYNYDGMRGRDYQPCNCDKD